MQVKTIGANGQISLGTSYAGQTVAVEEVEPGVWIIKLGDFVPRNERWLHEPDASAKLDRAFAWDESHRHEETDLKVLEERLQRDENPA